MLERVPVTVLASRVIASLDLRLGERLALRAGDNAIAIFTADCDDVGYTAIDEATKKAEVAVAYAASFYAGSGHASGPFSGEFIGVLSAPSPADARAGLRAALDFAAHDACFYRARGNREVTFYAHLVASCGDFLAQEAGVCAGTALAYLIAPPLEATFALDAALKAADVALAKYYPAPSNTNFSGALLSGPQAACQAACEAFQQAVLAVAEQPLDV